MTFLKHTFDAARIARRAAVVSVISLACLGCGGESTELGRSYREPESPSTPPGPSPLTPSDQRTTFGLPPGFEIELVSSEPDTGKIVDVAFDDAGRMWATTAVEYPLDLSSGLDPVELFRRGGRDRVLIFDRPTEPGPHRPRVFAGGLVMPLTVLPYRDGAFVGGGPDLLFLRDTDGDGEADTREVPLTGFGVQSSYTTLHRLMRGPGNWIYVAQGIGNRGVVRETSSRETVFEDAKIARFRPDGSSFGIQAWGANNAWGLLFDTRGQVFLQEANDWGMPAIPLYRGGSYRGSHLENKQRRYSPFQPALIGSVMDGSALSGLALAEDPQGCFPPPYDQAMFVVNPTGRKLQALEMRREGAFFAATKLGDFLRSSDLMFRPVAAHFGPDGCLYVVDWYNKVIDHAVAARDNPDQDFVHSRVWRIRHRDAQRREPIDFTTIPTPELPGYLGASRPWEARAAWHQIVDRQATELAPVLEATLRDGDRTIPERILALWSLLGLGAVTPSLLGEIIDDPSRDLRRECLQALSELAPEPSEILPFLSAYAEDPDPHVRLAVIHALNDLPRLDHEGAELLMRIRRAQEPLDDHRPEATAWRRKLPNFMRPKLQKPVAPAFRQFEASLVRSVIEDHAAEMAEVAGELGEALSLDERIGFLRAFDPRQAALLLVESKSRFTDAELELLVDQVATPGVSETVVALLDDRKTRRATLESLARRGATDIDPATRGNIEQATLALDDEDIDLQLALAAAYRLSAFETQALEIFENDAEPVARRQLALRTLRELRTAEVDRLFAVVTTLPTRSAMQLQAVDAILESPSPSARGYVIRLWPDLTPSARSRGAERLLSTAAGRDQFLQAIADGSVDPETVPLDLATRHTDVAASLGSGDGKEQPAHRSDDEFEPFLELARRPADPAEGRRLFNAYCQVCHEVEAVGGGVGPSLVGVAHRQTEDLLTSILTPSAAVEPGYRVVRVTVDGDVWDSSIEGVLVSEDAERIVIRPWGREDQTIAKDRIVTRELLPGSLMPEGLLQSLEPGQISALFAFLRTLE